MVFDFLKRAPEVAPKRSAGDADSGVALSLVTFFWPATRRRRERKLLRRRAHIPADGLGKGMLPGKPNAR